MEEDIIKFEPTEPIILSDDEKYALELLNLHLRSIKDRITSILELEREMKDMISTIDGIKGNPECPVCKDIEGFREKYKLFVDVLMKQISARQAKIDLLKQKNSTLSSEQLELKRKAYRDKLTGLYNRVVMDNVIIHNMNEAINHNYNFTLSILDIDNFKHVNDSFGHKFGDEILIKFAKFLEESVENLNKSRFVSANYKRLNKATLAFRYGGEEFIILSILSGEELKKFLDGCLYRFSQITHTFGDEKFNITFSGGVTEFIGGGLDPRNEHDLVHSADLLLYEAKKAGRARILMHEKKELVKA